MVASYRPHLKKDEIEGKTHSQTVATNIAPEMAMVHQVLERKGHAIETIRPQETIGHAVTLLRDKRIGALVVVDANGHLQGILSERDIVRKLAETPGQTLPKLVEEVMTSEVETCGPDDTLVSVLHRMNHGRFRHMPVVDGSGLIGVVSIGDVISYRLNQLEHEALQLKQLIVG